MGQRVYHITQSNQGTALPNIHHDPATMAEIQNALNVGKEVITHTDAVSVPGWSGAGYIIIDPQTGDGAYKIGGGQNGAWLLFGGAFLLVLGVFFIGIAGGLVLGMILASLGALSFLLGLAELLIVGADFAWKRGFEITISALYISSKIFKAVELPELIRKMIEIMRNVFF